ncbi:hypothetical protein ACOME3_009820 [Neoechinorhynchus agilis]
MIGLGDIIVPGIYIALLMRVDEHLNGKRLYSRLSFVCYVLSLILTMIILHSFNAAQPALLYIVPFCIIPTCALALVRREWTDLIGYSDHEQKETPAEVKKND